MSEVITREKIEDIFDQILIWNLSRANHGAIKEWLLKECQELDQLTVTRLRPMSEAPRDGESILLWNNECEEFMKRYSVDGTAWTTENYDESDLLILDMYDDDFEGWIPLPKYVPEQS